MDAQKLMTGGSDGSVGMGIPEDTPKKNSRTRKTPPKTTTRRTTDKRKKDQENAESAFSDVAAPVENVELAEEPIVISDEERERQAQIALAALDWKAESKSSKRNSAKYAFRIGDPLYVKSLDIKGLITQTYIIDGKKGYALKLLSAKGETIYETAFALEDDVVPIAIEPPQSEQDEAQAITAALLQRFDVACEKFAPALIYLHINPTTRQEDGEGIIGLQEALAGAMEHTAFVNYFKDNNIRRYFRALQNAMASLGGAHNVISDALKRIDALGDQASANDLDSIRRDAQENSFDRVMAARNFLKDSIAAAMPTTKVSSMTAVTTATPIAPVSSDPIAPTAKGYSKEFMRSVKSQQIPSRIAKIKTGVRKLIENVTAGEGEFVTSAQASALVSSAKSLRSSLAEAPEDVVVSLSNLQDAAKIVSEIVSDYDNLEGADVNDPEVGQDVNALYDEMEEVLNAFHDELESLNTAFTF